MGILIIVALLFVVARFYLTLGRIVAAAIKYLVLPLGGIILLWVLLRFAAR